MVEMGGSKMPFHYVHPIRVLFYTPFRVLVSLPPICVLVCSVHPICVLCATFTLLPHFDILDRQTAFVSRSPARFPLRSG